MSPTRRSLGHLLPALLLIGLASRAQTASGQISATQAPNDASIPHLSPDRGDDAASYSTPAAPGAVFLEDFQTDLSQWRYTTAEGYTGRFELGPGKRPAIPGDRGLIMTEKARKYGLSARVDGMSDMTGRALVVQYEVRLDEGSTCGGSYVKLLTDEYSGESVDGTTPYSVMFGPDRCGGASKIHLIVQTRHPESRKLREHHVRTPGHVPPPQDGRTHLYTLVVTAEGSYEVRVDGVTEVSGTLEEGFEPALRPDRLVDDATDRKPDDWVDEEMVPDVSASRPDDWATEEWLPDESAVRPDGWLEDEALKITDGAATRPDDWDGDADGEWEAPLVDNPKCVVGCGEWTRPKKRNPVFKGAWTAPLVRNPDFVGAWKARQMPNVEFYDVGALALLGVTGVAFELWSVDHGVVFDNVWIGLEVADAEKFGNATFGAKMAAEIAAGRKAADAAGGGDLTALASAEVEDGEVDEDGEVEGGDEDEDMDMDVNGEDDNDEHLTIGEWENGDEDDGDMDEKTEL